MSASAEFLNPSAAARQLGVSQKALRLYEQRGLIAPVRTAAGWRTYGPDQRARIAAIIFMRSLGLSLAQVARVLDGDEADFDPTLTAHQAALQCQIRELADAVDTISRLQASHARRSSLGATDPALLAKPFKDPCLAFDLPWPWGGERFELRDIGPINFLTGPLGSGKTRLALRLADVLPGAAFLGLDRASDGSAIQARLDAAPLWRERVNQTLTSLTEEGAVVSEALIALIVGLEAEGPAALVIDMVEQGLDLATQAALISHLRRRGTCARPLFLMTRSNVILDLATVGRDERIIYCPANHSPPILVNRYPGGTGYEAVATCLASPEVRARTEGMRAWLPTDRSWPIKSARKVPAALASAAAGL